jgi:hypothetical protein
MYKVITMERMGFESTYLIRLSDNASIPFDPANTDYANFKKDLADGAELQDSEGVIMTEEQVNQFIETLS